MNYLIQARKLSKHFTLRGGKILKAVDEIDLALSPGETLGLVGESGCGKSTVGRTLVGLYPVTSGEIAYRGKNINILSKTEKRNFTREAQIIFQDPYASINPYMTIGDVIAEGIDNFKLSTGSQRKERIIQLLEIVGLRSEHISRYPHEFSGGQRQRVGIARALAVEPSLIVCDEPISALDVSIQAQVVNLLAELQQQFQLTYLFISHDLSMVRYISNRVAVMYLGKIVELADCASLYAEPKHPYTQGLLAAIPVPDPDVEFNKRPQLLTGEIPSPLNPPSGCRFSSRCPKRMPHCSTLPPPVSQLTEGHSVACHLYSPDE